MTQQPASTPETIAFSGKIGEIVHTVQPDGRVFEKYRRPPGTRVILVSPSKQVLITKEHRLETGDVDFRLPGGKLRDSLVEYHQLLNSGKDLTLAAKEAATKEAAEETGYEVRNLRLVAKVNAGATVEWDLYYFICDDFTEIAHGQQLGQGEDIEVTWMSPDEIRQAIAQGNMQEWRSVGVLLGIVLPQLEASR